MRISDWSSDVCSSDLPQRSDRHRSNAHADLSASSTALERAPLAGKREAGAGDAPLHGLRNAILAAGNSSPPPPSWESAARSSRADRRRRPNRFVDPPLDAGAERSEPSTVPAALVSLSSVPGAPGLSLTRPRPETG